MDLRGAKILPGPTDTIRDIEGAVPRMGKQFWHMSLRNVHIARIMHEEITKLGLQVPNDLNVFQKRMQWTVGHLERTQSDTSHDILIIIFQKYKAASGAECKEHELEPVRLGFFLGQGEGLHLPAST